MKRLLYICRPNLGENLFATPCWELLAKEYDIYALIPSRLHPAFREYPYFKMVLNGVNHGSPQAKLHPSVMGQIAGMFDGNTGCYAYHHDADVSFFQSNPGLENIKPYGVLHDKGLNILPKGAWLSRTRKYMLKLKLMELKDTDNFDCTIRVPPYKKVAPSDQIIIYQGSREHLRKLPVSTISNFSNILPKAIYLVTQVTAAILRFNERGIRYIPTDPCTDTSLTQIISLFRTNPKVMIGPDAGLTQLALGYKIPYIWLQSRIPINAVIDIQYKNLYKVFSRKNLICEKACSGCKQIVGDNLPHGMFHVRGEKFYKSLECQNNPLISCLDYSEDEIQEIVSMI